MREKITRFMMGRNGVDDLSRFLNVVVFIFLLLGIFVSSFLSTLGFGILTYQYFRILSRNVYQRFRENTIYLNLRSGMIRWLFVRKQRFSERKAYRFFTCPSCKQVLRVPRGKGRIVLTCPKCREQFERKS